MVSRGNDQGEMEDVVLDLLSYHRDEGDLTGREEEFLKGLLEFKRFKGGLTPAQYARAHETVLRVLKRLSP